MPPQIDIIFLGTGSAVPSLKRHHPAILFRRAGEYFLFDCGECTQLGLERARIAQMKISRIFISHWHADHFAGLLPLIETLHMYKRTAPLYVYGPDANRFVYALLELCYWGIGFDIKVKECSVKKVQLLHSTEDYSIYSIPVKHTVPAVGFLFKERSHWNFDKAKLKAYGLEPGPILAKLKQKGKIRLNKKTIRLEDVAHEKPGRAIAYSGDTVAYEQFFKRIQGCDLLIHDGTFIEPVPERAHPSVKDVAALARKYKIKKLILTHISHRYTDPAQILKAAKSIFPNTIIAEDGMRIKL